MPRISRKILVVNHQETWLLLDVNITVYPNKTYIVSLFFLETLSVAPRHFDDIRRFNLRGLPVRVEVKRVRFQRQKKFSLDDHLYDIRFIRLSSENLLLLDMMDAINEAISKILEDLKEFYEQERNEHHKQVYRKSYRKVA